MSIFSKENNGFTLAEVLITLVVIGIVASLTIPVLLQSVQNAQLKVAFKKDYAITSQALTLMLKDNGGTVRGLFSNTDDMANKFLNYMSTIKQCPDGNTLGNCWAVSNITFLNGTTNNYNTSKAGAILNSGNYVMFTLTDSNCNDTGYSAKPVCGRVYFDVNGKQGPNIVGKDIFAVYISSDRVYPWGTWGTSVNSQEDTSTYGWGMAAQYLKE